MNPKPEAPGQCHQYNVNVIHQGQNAAENGVCVWYLSLTDDRTVSKPVWHYLEKKVKMSKSA